MTPLETLERAERAIACVRGAVDEEALVMGLRARHSDAFATLFGLYRAPVYNYVLRLTGDTEDAKDITQEVFLKAFGHLPDTGALTLRPWIFRVATTTCLDLMRARKRRAQTTPIDQREFAARVDPYDQAETGRLVEQCLRRLSDRHRAALVLKDLHGLHHDEIAAILGISQGAAETLLFRARAAFRDLFLQLSPPLEGAHESRDRRRVITDFAAAIPFVAVPASLHAPPAILSALGAAPAAATASAGAAGLLAKLTAALSVKTVVVVTAATVTVATVGVATERSLHRDAASRAGVAVAARSVRSADGSGAAVTATPADPGNGSVRGPHVNRPGATGHRASRAPHASRAAKAGSPGKAKGRSAQAPGKVKLGRGRATGRGDAVGGKASDQSNGGAPKSVTSANDSGGTDHAAEPPVTKPPRQHGPKHAVDVSQP